MLDGLGVKKTELVNQSPVGAYAIYTLGPGPGAVPGVTGGSVARAQTTAAVLFAEPNTIALTRSPELVAALAQFTKPTKPVFSPRPELVGKFEILKAPPELEKEARQFFKKPQAKEAPPTVTPPPAEPSLPSWVVPAAVGTGLLVVGLLLMRR